MQRREYHETLSTLMVTPIRGLHLRFLIRVDPRNLRLYELVVKYKARFN